jgi:hypothetical protein
MKWPLERKTPGPEWYIETPWCPPFPGTGFAIWVRPEDHYLTDPAMLAECDHSLAVAEFNAYQRGYEKGYQAAWRGE